MKRLALLALAAACTQAPTVAARHGEETTVTVSTAAEPSPVSTRARVEQRTASRSRPAATPKARVATGTHTLNWRALRDCESSNNYSDRDSSTYRGAYQFDRQTWQSVGGTGDPADASPAEQDMRAVRLYRERGKQPWPVCGRRL